MEFTYGQGQETDDMSESALAQLVSLQFVAAKVQWLQALLAAMQTAHNTYDKAPQDELAAES